MQELAGRTAVVTGAASGIGLACARRFARVGMKVVLADIEAGPLAQAAAQLEGDGCEVVGVPTDVSSWESVAALADRTLERFGAVHVLHSNAGVVLGGPVDRLSLADWQWVMGVNLWSCIYGVKAFLPHIKAAGEGHLVATASTAGLVSNPYIGPYNVTKFGVVALQETLQRELEAEDSPIRASVLCPGGVDTKIADAARNRPADSARAHVTSKEEERFIDTARTMLAARGKQPDEVAALVVSAIREQRFWVLTHEDWYDVLRHRVDALTTEGRLTHGFGG